MNAVKFRTKNLKNFIIRCITFDKCYVCEECNHVHRRDGNEIRLEEEEAKLYHPLRYSMWYKSVSSDCYSNIFQRLREIL